VPQDWQFLRPRLNSGWDVLVIERVAVVYLARVPGGIDAFKRFADSYRKRDAGYPHELVLLCKGLEKRGERAFIEEVFKGICYKIIATSDEGFDINAYLKVSAELEQDFVLFCNTYRDSCRRLAEENDGARHCP
jgi:hypothetical protein